MRVDRVTSDNIQRTVAFLETRADTALFLLSNLETFGPSLGPEPFSGDFYCISEDRDRLIAVFCLTRRGVLLVETHGRADLGPLVHDTILRTGIATGAVIAERQAADSVWLLLRNSPGFETDYESRERLYAIELDQRHQDMSPDSRVRSLAAADFDEWNQLNLTYLDETGMSLHGSTGERRVAFEKQTHARHWWGLVDGNRLLTTAALNAVYRHVAQVGAVYTVQNHRKKGLARATMERLITDAREVHALRRLVLFTGETNHAAEQLYRSMGFKVAGAYGVYFGAANRRR